MRAATAPTRGLTLIEVLVILAALVVLCAIYLPYAIEQAGRSKTPSDTTRLKRLAEALLAGQHDARARRVPRSTGHRFWLALVVGDGPGAGNLEIKGENDPDIYLSVGDGARLLVNPDDNTALHATELKPRLLHAVETGCGAAGLADTELMCSYAGPVDPRRDVKRSDNPIIGCTRPGVYPEGFSGVTSSAEARFYNYRDMADNYGWPADTETPLFGVAPLERVTSE